jgi:hypothetical protein
LSYRSADIMATELHLRPLESRNNLGQELSHVSVFLTEKGWLDRRDWLENQQQDDHFEPKYDIPIILRWDIMQGLPSSDSPSLVECPRDVAILCKSDKSECSRYYEVYQCQCKQGYDGNPYVDGGCQGLLYYSLCPD